MTFRSASIDFSRRIVLPVIALAAAGLPPTVLAQLPTIEDPSRGTGSFNGGSRFAVTHSGYWTTRRGAS